MNTITSAVRCGVHMALLHALLLWCSYSRSSASLTFLIRLSIILFITGTYWINSFTYVHTHIRTRNNIVDTLLTWVSSECVRTWIGTLCRDTEWALRYIRVETSHSIHYTYVHHQLVKPVGWWTWAVKNEKQYMHAGNDTWWTLGSIAYDTLKYVH